MQTEQVNFATQSSKITEITSQQWAFTDSLATRKLKKKKTGSRLEFSNLRVNFQKISIVLLPGRCPHLYILLIVKKLNELLQTKIALLTSHWSIISQANSPCEQKGCH